MIWGDTKNYKMWALSLSFFFTTERGREIDIKNKKQNKTKQNNDTKQSKLSMAKGSETARTTQR